MVDLCEIGPPAAISSGNDGEKGAEESTPPFKTTVAAAAVDPNTQTGVVVSGGVREDSVVPGKATILAKGAKSGTVTSEKGKKHGQGLMGVGGGGARATVGDFSGDFGADGGGSGGCGRRKKEIFKIKKGAQNDVVLGHLTVFWVR